VTGPRRLERCLVGSGSVCQRRVEGLDGGLEQRRASPSHRYVVGRMDPEGSAPVQQETVGRQTCRAAVVTLLASSPSAAAVLTVFAMALVSMSFSSNRRLGYGWGGLCMTRAEGLQLHQPLLKTRRISLECFELHLFGSEEGFALHSAGLQLGPPGRLASLGLTQRPFQLGGAILQWGKGWTREHGRAGAGLSSWRVCDSAVLPAS
jgi:hypothetical protein